MIQVLKAIILQTFKEKNSDLVGLVTPPFIDCTKRGDKRWYYKRRGPSYLFKNNFFQETFFKELYKIRLTISIKSRLTKSYSQTNRH